MTRIISKSGTGAPASDKLETAELAVDISNGDLYTKLADNSVVQINGGSGSGGGVEEAPVDGKQYARQDAGWSEITSTGGGSSLWEQNGDHIYYNDGNVGIGTDAPNRCLTVNNDSGSIVAAQYNRDNSAGGGTSNVIYQYSNDGVGRIVYSVDDSGANNRIQSTNDLEIETGAGQDIRFNTNGTNTRLTIDSTGNVGIGTGDPQALLEVKGSNASARFRGVGSQLINVNLSDSPSSAEIDVRNASDFFISKQGSPVVTINNDGNVGIGMKPVTRTAKEQLAEWKASFDARLKAEPKADKKAVTLEITDDAFEVLPTEEALAEWMETRAAGDKLQVNGNISASGTVNAAKEITTDFFLKTNAWRSKDNKSGLFLSGSSINPINYADGGQNGTSNGEISLGSADSRFKDAHFSGTVNADAAEIASYNFSGQDMWTTNGSGVRFNSSTIFPLDGSGALTNTGPDFGSSTRKFKDAHFSGTVNANKFVGDGSGLTGVGGGLPPGDFTHNGKITATDFIATSDERAKDNITTAPTGVLEQLHGREWDWKESGEKSAGVVAQELEAVLPHLVHEDEEGMKSVAYNGLVAYLIEEVKALRAEVEALKS